jgi:hypothetical protein
MPLPHARIVSHPGQADEHLKAPPLSSYTEWASDLLLPTTIHFLRRNTVTPATAPSILEPVQRRKPMLALEPASEPATVCPKVFHYFPV